MAERVHRVGPCYLFAGNPNIPQGAGMESLGFTRGDVTVAPNINVSTGRVDQRGQSALAGSAWSGGVDPMVTMPLIDEDKDKLAAYLQAGEKRESGALAVSGSIFERGVTGISAIAIAAGRTPAAGTWTIRATSGTQGQVYNPDGVAVGVAANFSAIAFADFTFTGNLAVTPAAVAGEILARWTVSGAVEAFGFGSGFEKYPVLNSLALIPQDEIGIGANGIDAPNAVWLPGFVVTDFGNLVYNLPESTDDAHVVHEVQARGLLLDFDARPTVAGGAVRTGTAQALLAKKFRCVFIGSPNALPAVTVGADTYAKPAWSLPPTIEV